MKVKIIKVITIDGCLLKENWRDPMQMVFLGNDDHKNRYYIDTLPVNGGTDWEQEKNKLSEVEVYFKDSTGYTWIQK